jgi:hypothetical protein
MVDRPALSPSIFLSVTLKKRRQMGSDDFLVPVLSQALQQDAGCKEKRKKENKIEKPRNPKPPQNLPKKSLRMGLS